MVIKQHCGERLLHQVFPVWGHDYEPHQTRCHQGMEQAGAMICDKGARDEALDMWLTAARETIAKMQSKLQAADKLCAAADHLLKEGEGYHEVRMAITDYSNCVAILPCSND
jgi:hypothetical protein